ncbi:MAG: response regulator [Novosphingobium sp.]
MKTLRAGSVDQLAVAGALFASVVLLWLVSDSLLVAAAFGGGLLVLALVATVVARRGRAIDAAEYPVPDWSVTVAAIDHDAVAVAITDRANRLVCANRIYADVFGANHAPSALPLDPSSVERLQGAVRKAWRDGQGDADPLVDGQNNRWSVSARRAGRGEDHLVWRFTRHQESGSGTEILDRLTGPIGDLLSSAGIEAAVVGQEGRIRGASRSFARRATGDEQGSVEGEDFVGLLRADAQDQIYFAREGREGIPQMLLQVPIPRPDGNAPVMDSGSPEILMLLVDAGLGIGGAAPVDAKAGTGQLEALLARLPVGLAMADRDGRLLFANKAFSRAAGLEAGKLPPYPTDLVVKEDKAALADAVRRFAQGAASSGDMAVRLKGLPDEPVSLGLAGVRGLGESAVLLSLADTTEEARLKQQVAQATKMQAVGQLAGGVAHDFNNVLTAIIGYCDLMLLRHTPGDSDYDDIQQIRANSNRAASLTRQLLAFSRQQTLRPEVLQVPDVVSEVSQLLKRLMGEKIAFHVHHDRDLGPVRADPQQLEQVIVNLAVNARDAIQSRGEPGGRLSLITRRISASDIRRMASDIIPIGDYTALIFEDTGGGIPVEYIGKVFEPFFSTKEKGKGTGLGLSTVYGIVKQSGGFIFAEIVSDHSGRQTGARFVIYLPVYYGTEPVAKAATPEMTREWSGGGRLLLVEDEDTVRAVAERALTREGYEVVTASDGEEGLEIIQSGEKFDLVVSDVVMPSMDGPAMLREIRKLESELPVLFMSGYAEAQLRQDIDVENMFFIAKPFSVQDITAKVTEILSRI